MAVVKPLKAQTNRIAPVLIVMLSLILAFLANLSLAPNIVIINARLDFFVLFLAVIILKQDRFMLILCAFACGILSDFMSTSTFGLYTLSYCLAAFVSSISKSSDLNQRPQPVSPLTKYVKLLCLVTASYAAIVALTLFTEGFEQYRAVIVETYLPAALYAYLVCMLIYLGLDIIKYVKGRERSSFNKGAISSPMVTLTKAKMPKRPARRGKSKWTQ